MIPVDPNAVQALIKALERSPDVQLYLHLSQQYAAAANAIVQSEQEELCPARAELTD